MPIYEYRCDKCDKVFERFQTIDAGLTIECPVCGKQSKRIISRSRFKLVGEGFYCNDYANKSEAKVDD